ncbi:DUF3800 domain-containing protein [Acidimicrobiales bacterium]|nr:DUF3800 domain-containing protein [Acidimicrobiales bacterium]
MARLVYIDETGSVGAKIKNQPILQLVAVIVDEENVQPLAKAMKEIASKHLGSYSADFEFHGNELWAAKGHWAGKSPPELLAAYEEAIGLLESFDLTVAHSSIDRKKLHDKYDGEYDSNAYLIALQLLLEKLDGLKGLKIIIADESKEQELQAIHMVGQLQDDWGFGVLPGRSLKTVIDSLHFVRSEASPGVQLADLCAYLYHRKRLRNVEPHSDAHAARDRMLDVIGSCTRTYRQRWPA